VPIFEPGWLAWSPVPTLAPGWLAWSLAPIFVGAPHAFLHETKNRTAGRLGHLRTQRRRRRNAGGCCTNQPNGDQIATYLRPWDGFWLSANWCAGGLCCPSISVPFLSPTSRRRSYLPLHHPPRRGDEHQRMWPPITAIVNSIGIWRDRRACVLQTERLENWKSPAGGDLPSRQ
jgi:hypothetical protein